jgi:hypothetical protein
MGLLTRNDTVRAMARRLAEAHRTTVAEAVRRALAQELGKLGRDRVERDGRIRKLRNELEVKSQRPPGDGDGHEKPGDPK